VETQKVARGEHEDTHPIVKDQDVHLRPVRERARPLHRDGEDLLEYSEGLARIAAGGGGAKALASYLAEAVGGAVLVEDADWRHLALAGSGNRSIPPSVRDLIAKTAVDAQGASISFPSDPESRAFPIKAGETRLGWLSVFPGGISLDGKDAIIRLTAASMAVELSRETSGSRGRRRSFWDRLLARAYDDPSEARDDAAARGINLAPGYVAVAVEAEGLDESVAAQKNGEIRKVCVDVLSTRTGEVVPLERGGGFVFLVPAPLEVDAANARTAATMISRGLTKAHVDVKVVGGVGRHADVLNVARSVDEARESLVIVRRMFGGGRVMAHEDLGFYPILLRGVASREELHEFSERVLEPLRAYDEKHQTELIRTLRLFFDVGQNIKVAAGSLNVHRHTVFYRLRQIGEISGLDLDSPHDQLTLRTAIALDALGR
jgi:PucR family transcriptional regulator, purine catabolism regulatory protein